MIDATHKLPVTKQAALLDLSRSNVYYLPRPVSDADLLLMRRIDELHLNFPFAGARMLRDMLKLEGAQVGRKHVRTLMDRMVFLSRVKSLCAQNSMTSDGIELHISAIAQMNERNPVVSYLERLKWDGTSRLDLLVAALNVSAVRAPAAKIALHRMLIQACAAADAGEHGMAANPGAKPKFEYVLMSTASHGNLTPEPMLPAESSANGDRRHFPDGERDDAARRRDPSRAERRVRDPETPHEAESLAAMSENSTR